MRALTLFLLLLTGSFLQAQVGVGTNAPTQELDVNGKLKISNDGRTPTAGTLRYTTVSDDFEGYDGREWKSLTEQKSTGTPSNPVPYVGRSGPISVGNQLASPGLVNLQSWEDSATSFNRVPSGMFFLVTRIQAQDNNLTSTFERIDCGVYAQAANNTVRSNSLVRMVGSNRELVTLAGDQSNPLMILRPNDRIVIFNNNLASQTTINVLIHGFLVDALDF
ncbi:hypothetical protein [Neolewinella persica]|uniref:hypothetical protein n=1 Tax=Neolewinella persica TaxID=70998 RepID=UPI0003787FA3|nr:hypothetical protein [Neolewinella persica]